MCTRIEDLSDLLDDADTIGAIAGGLAGVYWGYEAIPDRWLEKFTPEQRARLDQAAEGLLRIRRREQHERVFS